MLSFGRPAFKLCLRIVVDNSAFSLFSTRQLGLPESTTIYWEFRLNHVRLPKLHIWCISYTATLHSSLAPLIKDHRLVKAFRSYQPGTTSARAPKSPQNGHLWHLPDFRPVFVNVCQYKRNLNSHETWKMRLLNYLLARR